MGFDEAILRALDLFMRYMKNTPLVSICNNCEFCEYINYDGTVKCLKYSYTDAKLKCPYYKPVQRQQ
jgi:hypothetical protein